MNDSSVTLHRDGGITFSGPDATLLYTAISLRGAIRLFSKTGIAPGRGYTGSTMLGSAGQLTGKKYKRGQYEAAVADLTVWIDTMKAALPISIEGERA